VDPSLPLVQAYRNRFSVDSLVFYFASRHFGCYLEGFLERAEGSVSKSPSFYLDLVLDRGDAA
jgi:hypothetical protein